jgi:hypothetical protein
MTHREPPPGQKLERMVGALKAAGMTYKDIAQAAHVSHAAAWRAGNGQMSQPLYNTFTRIERLYEQTLGERQK